VTEDDDVEFRARLQALSEDLEKLTVQAATSFARIAANTAELLG
jgi:hypothetical protein